MKKLAALAILLTVLSAPDAGAQGKGSAQTPLAKIVDSYYEESHRMFPVNATFDGDFRYNDKLYADFTDSYRAQLRQMYQRYQKQLSAIRRGALSEKEQIDFDVMRREIAINLEGLRYHDNRIPFNQMNSLPNSLSLLGSGAVAQPFKTLRDYDNWLKRGAAFGAWADSAIVYFRKGIAEGYVLPEKLVVKTIGQVDALATDDIPKSTFYAPLSAMPASFSDADKSRLTTSYAQLITQTLNPAYRKLRDFLQKEYLPHARSSSGIGSVSGGAQYYDYLIRYYTTVNIPADSVFRLGLSEVARIRTEMERVKAQLGYKGKLSQFFLDMRKNPKVYHFSSEAEILSYYRAILPRIEPVLKKMFNHVPQTPFEVRAVEPFRVQSTPAHYFNGSLENGQPGIFYVPIIDATKTLVRESLFLHEAIPEHHYQISLQNENKSLSKFRQHSLNSGYAEGWGLYSESLGRELGLYTDPYQHMLALGDEMHRAVRLVVDAGMHSKGWTRERAIQYSIDNEPIEEQRAISETERYMADPGQALAYKIGELKLKQLRARYQKQLGKRFNLAAFHDAILGDGCLPLDVLERKMVAWAKKQ